MIMRAKAILRRFGRREDGHATIEFALAMPLIFTMFLTSVEMGIYSFRQTLLDRGLDLTVREIRLGTGVQFTHTELKNKVCDYSGLPGDCETVLRLSLKPVAVRGFTGVGANTDCIDVSQTLEPPSVFSLGLDNEMMLVRACYMFKPVFPSTGLGYAFTKDGSGRSKMVSLAAFVQEPR